MEKKTDIIDTLQMACVAWFGYSFPRLRLLLHHSPNGGLLPSGARDGAKRKAMGVRAGFPDLVLLVPSADGRWGYLCVELKSARGRQRESQREYQAAVESVGGKYVICHDVGAFRENIMAYLGIRK